MMITLACSSQESKEEQIRVESTTTETPKIDTANSIRGGLALSQVYSAPNSVVQTGIAQHRLVTIYKSRFEDRGEEGSSRYYYSAEENEGYQHFMPGIDLIFGYNLLNIAHYDMATEQMNYLFDHPVLVKSLYYPSFEQDSLNDKPINRDYYLVSAYDADTNTDTLINKSDLRRFYYFNVSANEKLQLIPPDYSVVRSQYDPMNDVMYIFAKHDVNKNGTTEDKEPMHIFWISLKAPAKAKRLY